MKLTPRRVALYPGAFRPPHINHFEQVLHLRELPDVDEVVVIIANRVRHIPGTSKVLNPDVSLEIWQHFLHSRSRIRVEVAPGSAVAQALAHVESGNPGDSFLLAVGAKDYDGESTRFKKLRSRPDVETEIYVLHDPERPVDVSGTRMRSYLALGDAGQDQFKGRLPIHLTDTERNNVWSICIGAMTEAGNATEQAIAEAITTNGFRQVATMEKAISGKRDPVYRVELVDGQVVFAKCAVGTVSAAGIAGPTDPKPRRRLKAEREALKWIHATLPLDIEVPQVMAFDKATKTLILTEVCAGGPTLEEVLSTGHFDMDVARRIGRFLAQCHTAVPPLARFWDSDKRELAHWRAMLALRTMAIPGSTDGTAHALEVLARDSDDNRVPVFTHLDLTTRNVLCRGSLTGVIDFELSCSLGDPAYDLGVFLAGYVHAGIQTGSMHSALAAIDETLSSYAEAAGPATQEQTSRVVSFSAAALLGLDFGSGAGRRRRNEPGDPRVSAVARMLLVSDTFAEVFDRSDYESKPIPKRSNA